MTSKKIELKPLHNNTRYNGFYFFYSLLNLIILEMQTQKKQIYRRICLISNSWLTHSRILSGIAFCKRFQTKFWQTFFLNLHQFCSSNSWFTFVYKHIGNKYMLATIGFFSVSLGIKTCRREWLLKRLISTQSFITSRGILAGRRVSTS